MSIKYRIWALPIIAAIIFCLGFGVSATFSTAALSSIKKMASTDYPVLEMTKALTLDVLTITTQFKDAVAEGDRQSLDRSAEIAVSVHQRLKMMATIPEQRDRAKRLTTEFDMYYVNALSSARMMLGMEDGDPEPFVQK